MYRRRKRGMMRGWVAVLGALVASAVLAQDATKPNEEVTGKGGHFLHYSSTQTNVELGEKDQQTLQRVRDHRYSARLDPVLDAAVQTLREQGYETTMVDREFHLVEARHNEVLVSQGREVLRGVLKAKVPLPSKPDHQTTEALILLEPAPDGQGVFARTRFRRTVWDSNGDSRTSVLSDAAIYDQFYGALATHLSR
ncbi:hypothetical protein DYST_01706 [Dyella terrae]|nr:hypothetical protein DYST_01706 [Dyella terrae]